MTSYIALLRAVNVGGKNPVAMADLRALLARLGLVGGQTLLQSGNAVFRAPARPARTPAQLERLLEAAASHHLGLATEFFVRSARDWQSIIARNPFPKEAERDPGHLVVMCLKDAPTAAAVRATQAGISGGEVVRAVGRQAYVAYPDGIGRSRLTHAVLEKRLGTRGTGRNWNTVLKLGALAGG